MDAVDRRCKIVLSMQGTRIDWRGNLYCECALLTATEVNNSSSIMLANSTDIYQLETMMQKNITF